MRIEQDRKLPLAFVLAIGAVFVYLTRNVKFLDFSNVNTQCAKLLGIGLVGTGVISLGLDARYVVDIDRQRRKIRFIRSTRFGKNVKEFSFDEILAVDVWKRRDDQVSYHIFLCLSDGREYVTGLRWFRAEGASQCGREIANCVGCEFITRIQ